MSDLLIARSQMAMSLAFHILFAVAGMAMPLLMVVAEALWLRTGDAGWKELAQRWAKGTAVLFAVGAVSGTVLSFELGLLWPTFMEWAGGLIGMPFSLEGFAFFLEAIFLGIYLYGWEKVPPKLHLAAGIGVMLSGVTSAVFVVSANAWMNTPAGFTLVDGVVTDVDPWAAMFNPAFPTQALHMVLAAFVTVGFAVAGVHAWFLQRAPDPAAPALGFHRKALSIAIVVGGVAAFLQPLSGDLSAKHLAHEQPVKLAAMEAHWETEAWAPLRIGGWPDEEAEETHYSIDIPGGLSFLSYMDPRAEVAGLKEVPRDERPPVAVVHVAFQLMVAAGLGMMAVAALFGFRAWRKRGLPLDRWLLRAVVLSGPLGFVALEAGWVVTEVGRQPWIIHGVMRTADAVTPMPGLAVPFASFTVLYAILGVSVVVLLRRIVFLTDPEAPAPALPAGEARHA
jgi:cytochrome d ubiquinol oxidase subunit I